MSNLSEYGISNEKIEDFCSRNEYPAKPKFPDDLNGKSVSKSPEIPFLPIDWEYEIPVQDMYHEAHKLRKHYVPHRHHETHKGWSSLVIHGISSVHTESSHTYGYNDETAPWRWTDIADHCPTISDFFKNHFDYDRYFRIRIMKLSPGGYVIPHKDSLDESENHIGPINFALNNPENCNFYMDGVGYLPWVAGRFMKLNLYNVHAVWNRSNEDRYHIIVHGIAGKSWSERILNNYLEWKKIYV
jgi:hypothetical protein